MKHFTEIYQPDLIFLSEPQIFIHDVEQIMGYLKGEYNYSLNTADKYDQELALVKNRANGGTMVCWKTCLDPYVTPHPVSSPSFLPILFQPPGSPLSIHISVNLTTLGQEPQFMEKLSKFSNIMEELELLRLQLPIFLRGDFNVNFKIKSRKNLLEYFSDDHNLQHVMIEHPTYHHFLFQYLTISISLFCEIFYFPTIITYKLIFLVFVLYPPHIPGPLHPPSSRGQ